MGEKVKNQRGKITEYLFEKLKFEPTEAQSPILECRKRFILVAGGEQAGKSMVASKYLVSRFLETEESGLYWLVAADYERTRAEFNYLVEDFAALGILASVTKRVDPGNMILADGTRIETKSAKDPRTLAMKAPDGIIGCEASQLDLDSFHRLRSRVAPKRGWLFLGGTFEGSLGWYPQLFTNWNRGALDDEQSFSLPSYTNKHLYPEGKRDPEILKLRAQSSDEFFMERIEGIPSPPQGLVFGEFRPDIHIDREAKWVKGEPVYLWIDPGYAGAYAVEVAQEINGQINIIDEIFEQGLITTEIIEIAKSRRWWQDVVGGAIDIAGYQHQAMSAPAEIWLEAGVYLDAKKIRINEGTERLKGFLRPDPTTNVPKIVFNPSCQGILSEFGVAQSPIDGQTRAYRWKIDRDGNIVGESPEDKNNHAVKAVIYGLIDRYGYGYVTSRSFIKVKRWR